MTWPAGASGAEALESDSPGENWSPELRATTKHGQRLRVDSPLGPSTAKVPPDEQDDGRNNHDGSASADIASNAFVRRSGKEAEQAEADTPWKPPIAFHIRNDG